MGNRRTRTLATAFLTAVVGFLGVTTPLSEAAADQRDIVDRLNAIPGMTVVSESPAPVSGYRLFTLDYRQPVDHRNSAAGGFSQRAQLWHKDTARPAVIYTNGYEVPATAALSEPAQLLGANQLTVGQRFFTDSRPEPADWSKLDIWQAASDHHRLVTALKGVYHAKWVASGIAKGGGTAVYHRRFYPDDVTGVVAYGAPDNVDDDEDSRYNDFFDEVGPAGCRDALKDLQRTALDRRDDLVRRYTTWAEQNKLTFDQVLGNADKAFELIVVHLPFAFWQFFQEKDCARIPAPTASTDAIWTFLDEIVSWHTPVDQTVLTRSAWFYQAADQIGFPSLRPRHLAGLLHYPDVHEAATLLPPALRPPRDPSAMKDIDAWVRTRSTRMLFVNGDHDPGRAEAFVPSGKDSLAFTIAGASYPTARIAALPLTERAAATAALKRWAAV